MSAEPAPAPPLPGWLEPLVRAAATAASGDFLRYGPDTPPAGGRRSAVLILLADGPAGPEVLLIQRAEQLRKHAGQPAFPGGAADPDDRGPEGTALREAAEEVGLDPAGVRVVALLPELYLAPTGFVVTPVLAWWHTPHEVGVVDPGEVARVERVPVAELTDPANRCRVRHPSGYTGPAFAVRGMVVWGFTGAVLDRLLELAGWDRPWDLDDVRDLPQRALDLSSRGVPPDFRPAAAEPEDDGPAADDLIPSSACPAHGDRGESPGTVER
jgi:8-oxo-dGTP pyrophosphatase MutT (NUDIX family)